MFRKSLFILTLASAMLFCRARFAPAQEAAAGEAVGELFTQVEHDFPAETAEIGGPNALRSEVETCTGEYGFAETSEVFQQIGPDAGQELDKVPTALRPDAFRIMATYGRQSLSIFESHEQLALFEAYGSPAAKAMILEPGIAEDAIAKDGLPAAEAMTKIGNPEAVELDHMIENGELAKEGEPAALLDRIAAGGNKTVAALWKNRRGLAAAGGVALLIGGIVHVVGSIVSSVGGAVMKAVHTIATIQEHPFAGLAVILLIAAIAAIAFLAFIRLWRFLKRAAKQLIIRLRKVGADAKIPSQPSPKINALHGGEGPAE